MFLKKIVVVLTFGCNKKWSLNWPYFKPSWKLKGPFALNYVGNKHVGVSNKNVNVATWPWWFELLSTFKQRNLVTCLYFMVWLQLYKSVMLHQFKWGYNIQGKYEFNGTNNNNLSYILCQRLFLSNKFGWFNPRGQYTIWLHHLTRY
jgi:hypothetical protein